MAKVWTTEMVAVAAEISATDLAKLLGLLKDADINLKAYAADESGIRLFPADPEPAKKVITEAGFYCQIVEVLGIDVGNEPGALRAVMDVLSDAGVRILSTFGMGIKNAGRLFIRVDDVPRALAVVEAGL